jgi:hypothetical protein
MGNDVFPPAKSFVELGPDFHRAAGFQLVQGQYQQRTVFAVAIDDLVKLIEPHITNGKGIRVKGTVFDGEIAGTVANNPETGFFPEYTGKWNRFFGEIAHYPPSDRGCMQILRPQNGAG